jgi:hypothetical protein
MYKSQKLKVRWEDVDSHEFFATNGVKQGGILSPVLFAIYIDGLLTKLKFSGYGCQVGNEYVGALSYADDVTLLCPTIFGLNKMVEIAEQYASEFSIVFNGSKSKLLCFNNSGVTLNPTVVINDEQITPSNSVIHLGHYISTCNNNGAVTYVKNAFWRSFNLFNSDLGTLSPELKCNLFAKYCCSFYGIQLVNLFSNETTEIYISWRKALRCLWNVHPQTHGEILAVISDMIPIQLNIYKRYCKFITQCITSKNPIVKAISNMAIVNPYSSCHKNYTNLFTRDGACKISSFVNEWSQRSQVIENHCILIKELISVRDNQCQLSGFNTDDVTDFLTILCTT